MYAEDVNYWKTGRSGADQWIDKAKREIRAVGGIVLGSGSFTDETTGNGGILLSFAFGEDEYTMKWVVLKSKTGDVVSARRQAATALYHEVKAACVKLKFLGARAAFLPYLVLPGGRTAMELSAPDLTRLLPPVISGQQLRLGDDGGDNG